MYRGGNAGLPSRRGDEKSCEGFCLISAPLRHPLHGVFATAWPKPATIWLTKNAFDPVSVRWQCRSALLAVSRVVRLDSRTRRGAVDAKRQRAGALAQRCNVGGNSLRGNRTARGGIKPAEYGFHRSEVG